MKFVLATLLVALASTSALADEDWEGDYVKGSVTITRSVGARGGDEFESNKCANKVFKTQPYQSIKVSVGEREAFAIVSEPPYTKLEVTGNNQCMPKGTYTRKR